MSYSLASFRSERQAAFQLLLSFLFLAFLNSSVSALELPVLKDPIDIQGAPVKGAPGVSERTDSIMAREKIHEIQAKARHTFVYGRMPVRPLIETVSNAPALEPSGPN